MSTLLITGGAGFIGSNLVHYALAETSHRLVVVDKLTYAGSLLNLEQALKDPRVTFVRADIADAGAMARVFADARPDAVVNLAAETHVDRSIDRPQSFIETNIVGTYTILEAVRKGSHPDAEKLPRHEIINRIESNRIPQEIIAFFGAGDIGELAHAFGKRQTEMSV